MMTPTLQQELSKLNPPLIAPGDSERAETLQALRLRRLQALTCLDRPFSPQRSRCLDRLDAMIERLAVAI